MSGHPTVQNKLAEFAYAVVSVVRIDSRERQSINREVRAHLEDASAELRSQGLGEDEARTAAVASFGDAHAIATELAAIHSAGTWRDAFLTSLPHLLVALLLTAYFRNSPECAIAFAVAAGVGVVHVVRYRAPSWSFSWLGYWLLPVVLVSFMLLGATRWWALAGVAYTPVALLVIVYVIRRTASRDLLYVSLMLAPWVVVSAWCVATHNLTNLQRGVVNAHGLHEYGRDMVGTFVALAISSFVFARVKPRWAKALALLVPLAMVFGYITFRCCETLAPWGCLVPAVALVLIAVPTVREFWE
jgi:type IV secretory pathway VirB3-like protein